MIPQTRLRRALEDKQLLGASLEGPSWHVWRSILLAAMGEALKADEIETFRRLTGGREPPNKRVDELWAVVGRRGGKSSAIAALAVYIAAMCKHKLSRGERGIVLCIAPDQRQARVVLGYCVGVLESTPLLSKFIARCNADSVELTNGHVIEVRSASFRRLRGITCLATICDEAAFWHSEDSTNPDSEILGAVRPTLATTGGPLIVISSPYARRGEMWETYRRNFRSDGDPGILVCQGTSRDFNPSLPQSVIDRAMERDEPAARAEYLAEFRTDIEGFINRDAVVACITAGVRERMPENRNHYVAFCDPSGGSGDSMTLAIIHKEGKVIVLDAVRESRPPFSPEAVVAEQAELMRKYRIAQVFGDRYAGEWPREQFRHYGINYEPADKSKSDLYIDLLPLLNSRNIDLLDNERLISQITGLERKTARSGKDSIDHSPGGHDDLANAVAGAAVYADRAGGVKLKYIEVPLVASW
jgi:hypothetical protein